MKSIPKHLTLYKEHPDHYEIHDARDNKTFPVAKRHLSLAMHEKLSKIQRFDEGGTAKTDAPADSSSDAPQQAPVTVNVGTPTAQPIQAAQMTPPVSAPPYDPNAPLPQVQTAKIPAPNLGAPLVQQAKENEALGETAISGQQKAEAQEEALKLKAQNDYQKAQQDLFAKTQQDNQNMLKEHEALTQAVIDGKIDPDNFWKTHTVFGSTGAAKATAALGIILGGIGQAFMGTNQNSALQVINKRIGDDIDAQKANLGKKQTLLSMNLQKYRDINAASQATANQMRSIYEGQIMAAALKTGNAKSIAAAQAAMAKLRSETVATIPSLVDQDARINALNELQGKPATPSATQTILGNTPSIPGAKGVANPQEPVSAEPAQGADKLQSDVQSAKGVVNHLLDSLNTQTGAQDPVVTNSPPPQIDQNRLNKIRLVGAPYASKEQIDKADKEIEELQNSESTKQLVKNYYDRMISSMRHNQISAQASQIKNMLTGIPVLGGVLEKMPGTTNAQREFEASRGAALDKITGLLTKRIGGEAMKNLEKSLPTFGDDLPTIQQKYQNITDMIDSSTPTTTLKALKVLK